MSKEKDENLQDGGRRDAQRDARVRVHAAPAAAYHDPLGTSCNAMDDLLMAFGEAPPQSAAVPKAAATAPPPNPASMDELLLAFGEATVMEEQRVESPADGVWTPILSHWEEHRTTPHVRQLFLAGVPESVQGGLWLTAFTGNVGTGASSTHEASEALFERSADEASTLRERLDFDWNGDLRRAQPRLNELAVVTADVPRTSPDLQRTGELSAAELTRVLDAFVVASSDSGGYTQGMADVVAWLLLHDLAGWQCFTILRSLVSRPLLRAAMSLDQACWDGISEVYANHLALPGVAPQLAAHFRAVGLQPFFFLPEWLVALWCRTLRPDAARLAWNMTLLDGDLSLIVTALAVTRALAPDLLQCRDLAACRDALRDGPRTLSYEGFRDACSGVALRPGLLQPLARWVDVVPSSATDGAALMAEDLVESPERPPPPPPPPMPSVTNPANALIDDIPAFPGFSAPPPPPPASVPALTSKASSLPENFLDFLDKPR